MICRDLGFQRGHALKGDEKRNEMSKYTLTNANDPFQETGEHHLLYTCHQDLSRGCKFGWVTGEEECTNKENRALISCEDPYDKSRIYGPDELLEGDSLDLRCTLGPFTNITQIKTINWY